MSTTAALIDPQDGFDSPTATGDPAKKAAIALRCLVVTPEATAVDEPASFVALPLYDGELGILPGRAPLIGRLGYGELRIRTETTTHRFFVDGGFAQVRDNVITVLTSRAIPAEAVNAEAAQAELAAAKARRATTDLELAEKGRAEARARALVRVADHKAGASH